MARIKACRRLWRRSKEDKRRLSEGRGGTRREDNSRADDDHKGAPQTDVMELEIEEIDQAFLCLFQFNEVEASLLMREHELNEGKDLLDEKISALKMATRSPDSNNVKRIKFATRRSLELMDRISDLRRELAAVKLQQTSQQAKYRLSLAIVDQHLSSQEDNQGLVLGFLGHVWRLAEE